MLKKCAFCSGSGRYPGYSKPCTVCNGAGQNDVPSDHVRCNFCSGSGRQPGYSKPCEACSGTDVVKPSRFR